MSIQDAKVKCSAKSKRSGVKCKNAAVTDSDKCRIHGGKSPKGMASPHFKSGQFSKLDYLPKKLAGRIEKIYGDQLVNLEQSIEIQKTLETRYLEKLGSTESTEAWVKLKKAVSEYNEASHDPDQAKRITGQAKAFGMINFIVNEGLSESFLHRDIQAIHESQRKITETLSRCRKEKQEIYTQEELNQILEIYLRAVRNNVADRGTLTNIQKDIESNVREIETVQ